jgi:hypothetical protein
VDSLGEEIDRRNAPMHVNWSGIYPAVTTQFETDQSLDLAATIIRHSIATLPCRSRERVRRV